jgi:hypothetical protein
MVHRFRGDCIEGKQRTLIRRTPNGGKGDFFFLYPATGSAHVDP